MILILKNKVFPPLNVINVKISQLKSKGSLRHYHYREYPKLCHGFVGVIIITCSCHVCTTELSLPWYPKNKIHVISKDMGKFPIASTLQLLDLKTTGLL